MTDTSITANTIIRDIVGLARLSFAAIVDKSGVITHELHGLALCIVHLSTQYLALDIFNWKFYNNIMKCQGKEIRATDTQDCPNDATGMFRTVRGVFPLCQEHSAFCKQYRLLVRKTSDWDF